MWVLNRKSVQTGYTFELREHPKAHLYQLTREIWLRAHVNSMRYGNNEVRYA